MAEEAQKVTTTTTTTTTTQEENKSVEEVVGVSDDAKTSAVEVVEKEAAVPVPESEEQVEKPKVIEEECVKGGEEEEKVIPQSASFKEESNKVSDLSESEKKALDEFKSLVRDALNKHEFSALFAPPVIKEEEKKEEKKEGEEEKKEGEEETKTEAVVVEEKVEDKKEGEEETKTEAVVEEKKEEKSESVVVEEKVEEGVVKEKKEEKSESVVVEEKAEAVVEEKKEEKNESSVVEEKVEAVVSTSVDDDGAKTVEAIEETIVAVSSSSAPPENVTEGEKEQSEAKTETEECKEETKEPVEPEEVCIWGIKLLEDERSDVILLKFLRARDFKVKDAFTMLKNTIKWRKQFGIEELLEEDLGDDLEKVVFMHGFDKEGHPVCYNVYGEFQNKELYQKTFSDEEKRQRFLRWRIQFLEKSIRKLDFTPGGISTIVQVNDLKNSPGPAKRELRQATRQALQLLQDNYPEFVARQIFVNVPWWYLAFNKMISPFLTQRTRSKFTFAGPSKTAEALLRHIAPEQLPVKYGGLGKEGEFGTADAVTEITVKPAAKHTIEFPVTEVCQLTWEVRVVGWEVSYGAEFVPSAEESYTVIIQKARKVPATDEPVICNNFKIGEPGKVVLTIDNVSSKKKKLLYRLKTKASSD